MVIKNITQTYGLITARAVRMRRPVNSVLMVSGLEHGTRAAGEWLSTSHANLAGGRADQGR
jgi:hypothetical protein